jgi:3D (Asp-Asp-Asp) domain-containing protein
MTKDIIKKASMLVCMCSLVLVIISIPHTKKNEVAEVTLPIVELNRTVKIKSPNSNLVIQNKVEEKKQPLDKQIVAIKTNKTLSRGGSIDYDTTFELTFYSGLACENSKYGAVNHKGVKLFDGVVANNVLPYKTKIKLDGWGMVEVLDVGGNDFDSSKRLDVYVPRNKGESDGDYYNRVQKMGVVKVKGKIIN